MKRFGLNRWAVVSVLLGFLVTVALAWQRDPHDVEHTAKHVFAAQSTLDIQGTINIDDLTIDDDLTLSDTVVFTDVNIDGTATSGTSKYQLYIDPDGSEVGAVGRTDGVHIGDESNCAATNKQFVALYVSAGRASNATTIAHSTWPSASPDTGLRVVAVNRAVNDATQYDIRGAYIKAKNYLGGTVKGVQGLWIEAINDGTDTGGASYGIAIGTDTSTIDYGLDMDAMATPATADIRFSNGGLIKNGDANTLTFTEATCAFVGAVTVSANFSAVGTVILTNTTIIAQGATCVTTNQTFLKSTGVTGTLYIVDGLITRVQ